MTQYTSCLLLGGNEGNVAQQLSNAILLLQEKLGNIIAQSAIYQSPAWGFEHPQAFLNQVVCIRTNCSPLEQLNICQTIENQLGRIRNIHSQTYQARTMDIDILFIDDMLINTEKLIVPHPLIAQRRFALQPLNDILPHYIHPLLQQSINQLLASCSDNSEVILYNSAN